MKTEIKEVHKCDFCKKKLFIKTAMVKHELQCFNNPLNARPCFGCHCLEKKETEIYSDHPMGGELGRKVQLFYCNNFKKFLHTPQNEMKGNAYDLGDDTNEPMPFTCEIYNNQSAHIDFF